MPTPSPLRPLPVLAAALLLAAACGLGGERTAESAGEGTAAGAPPSAGERAGTAGGQSITTTDGAVTLGIAGDRIVVGLSDSVLGQIQGKVEEQTADSQPGSLGGLIKGAVRSAVTGALSTKLEYRLADVQEVSYDGRRLRLVLRDGGSQLENARVNNRPVLESFAPDDARRFVDAVRAAKAAQGIQ